MRVPCNEDNQTVRHACYTNHPQFTSILTLRQLNNQGTARWRGGLFISMLWLRRILIEIDLFNFANQYLSPFHYSISSPKSCCNTVLFRTCNSSLSTLHTIMFLLHRTSSFGRLRNLLSNVGQSTAETLSSDLINIFCSHRWQELLYIGKTKRSLLLPPLPSILPYQSTRNYVYMVRFSLTAHWPGTGTLQRSLPQYVRLPKISAGSDSLLTVANVCWDPTQQPRESTAVSIIYRETTRLLEE